MKAIDIYNRLNEISEDKKILQEIKQKVWNGSREINVHEELLKKILKQWEQEEKDLLNKLSNM